MKPDLSNPEQPIRPEVAGNPGPAPRGVGHGILVAEDQAPLRNALGWFLKEEGFTVWLANTGEEAVQLYRREGRRIDVVLLDVHMPGLDGPKTLVALRGINPVVLCCFMSGDLTPYTEEQLRQLGARHVFRKPFGVDELEEMLRTLPPGAKSSVE